MFTLYRIHSLFGEMILPILILIALIWGAVAWKAGGATGKVLRLLAVLVDIQFLLGLIWWIYGLAEGFGKNRGEGSFPFLFHPILGLLAVGCAHIAARKETKRAVVGTSFVLLALVIAAILVAKATH